MISNRTKALGLVLSCVVVLPTHAWGATKPKPKPVCNLLQDPAGDAKGPGGITGAEAGAPAGKATASSSLDIVSADIASDGVVVTAVVRVKQLLKPEDDTFAPTGRTWQVSANVGDKNFALNAWDSRLGSSFGVGTGKIDIMRNEIRISRMVKDITTVAIARGSVLTAIIASSEAVVDTGSAGAVGTAGGSSDSVGGLESSATYVVGTPSCVKLGA